MNRAEALRALDAASKRLLSCVAPGLDGRDVEAIRDAYFVLARDDAEPERRMVKLSLASGSDVFVRPCEVACIHGAVGDDTQTVIVFRYENGGRGLPTRVLGSAEYVARALGLYTEGG